MSDKKIAYCPKAYAQTLGLSKLWADDAKEPGSMGKPVAVLTTKAAEAFIAKAPALAQITVTENGKDKENGSAVTVAQFLRSVAKTSEEQGYLSMSDLRDAANIAAQVGPAVGHVAFRNVCNKLVALGCIANARGKKAKEVHDTTGIDWSAFDLDAGDDGLTLGEEA